MSENSDKTITAFHDIFKSRLNQLVKEIKKIRKDPTKQDKLKKCLFEAKELKKTLKKSTKQAVKIISGTITAAYCLNEDGTLQFNSPDKMYTSDGVAVVEITTYITPSPDDQKVISINFTVKQL